MAVPAALCSTGRVRHFEAGHGLIGEGSTSRVSASVSASQPTPKRRRARRADQPRTKRVHLRLNETEHRLIELAAERAGLSSGAYSARAAVAVAKDEIDRKSTRL